MKEIFVEIYIQLIKLKILKTEKNSIDYFQHPIMHLVYPPPLPPNFTNLLSLKTMLIQTFWG